MDKENKSETGVFGWKDVRSIAFMGGCILVATVLHRTLLQDPISTIIYWITVTLFGIGIAVSVMHFFLQCFFPQKLYAIRAWADGKFK